LKSLAAIFPDEKISAALNSIFVVQQSTLLHYCLVVQGRGQYLVSLKNKNK